jgi:hypothetical protein
VIGLSNSNSMAGLPASLLGGGNGGGLVLNDLYVNLDASDPLSYSGTGATWFDLSGNSNDFTLYNGVSYSPIDGGQLVCDGVDDYLQATINETTAAFSAFAYVKCSDLTQGLFSGYYIQHAISRRSNTAPSTSYYQLGFLFPQADWGTYLYSGQFFTIFNGTGAASGHDNSTPPLTYYEQNDEWVYLGFTTDGTNGGEVNVYFNGVKIIADTLTFDRNIGNAATRLMSNGWDLNFAMEGSIRNVHMYTRKLSEVEVTQNYNATKL